MTATATATTAKTEITLRGSVEIVTEFFGYSINRYGAKQDSLSSASAWVWVWGQPPPATTTARFTLQHFVSARNLSPRGVRACGKVRFEHPSDDR